MKHLEVFSAYDQVKIGSLPMVNLEEAKKMVSQSYALFGDQDKKLSAEKRAKILNKTADIIASRRQELALQAAKEGGKPLQDSLVEIDRAVAGIKVAIEEISQIKGTQIPMDLSPSSANRMAYTKMIPRGVVFAISAFNHPFNLIVHQAIPAVAVGCPVLVKPAGATPLSCQSLVEILYEAGLPKEWCQIMVCDRHVAEEIVSDERVSFLTFIGSGKVGWHLRSKLAPGATCALEHGGAAPAIVDSTADLDKAIPLLAKGGFYHAGQVCVSVQRIFVHKDIKNSLMERLVSAVKNLRVGDPQDPATEVGPLISPKEVDRVDSWVKAAASGGGKIVAGGDKLSETCYQPTILVDPPLSADVSTKEIFGPVVCVYSYSDLDEAIEKANSVDFAFQACVFTKNIDVMTKAIDRLEGLAVMVNDHSAFRVDWMPFGGYKQSGLGVGGIGHTMKDMMIEKMFVISKS